MRAIIILFTLLMASFVAPAEAGRLKIIQDDVRYIEYHDPGWMKLVLPDGREVRAEFYYSLITFKEIQKWIEGESVAVAFSSKHGVGILRHKNGEFYKVFMTEEWHPLDMMEDQCLEKAVTIIDHAECYRESSDGWNAEKKFILGYIHNHMSEEIYRALEASQKHWQAYKDSFFDAYKIYGKEMGGTMMSIRAASIAASMSKKQALWLLSFLE